MKFYKPTPKCTGAACNWSVKAKAGSLEDIKENGVYLEMVKQVSWDDTAKQGAFKDGQKIWIKLKPEEIGEIMFAFSKGKPAWKQQDGSSRQIHKSPKGTTIIGFGPYFNKQTNELRGFSFSASKKEDGETISIAIGYTFGEMMALLEWFRFALEKIYSADYSFSKKLGESYSKSKNEQEDKPAPKQQQEQEDYQSEDIPF